MPVSRILYAPKMGLKALCDYQKTRQIGVFDLPAVHHHFPYSTRRFDELSVNGSIIKGPKQQNLGAKPLTAHSGAAAARVGACAYSPGCLFAVLAMILISTISSLRASSATPRMVQAGKSERMNSSLMARKSLKVSARPTW